MTQAAVASSFKLQTQEMSLFIDVFTFCLIVKFDNFFNPKFDRLLSVLVRVFRCVIENQKFVRKSYKHGQVSMCPKLERNTKKVEETTRHHTLFTRIEADSRQRL